MRKKAVKDVSLLYLMVKKEKSSDESFLPVYSVVGRIFGKGVHQQDEAAALIVEEFGWVVGAHFLIGSEC